MRIPENIQVYRQEIIQTDSSNQMILLVWVLAMIFLTVYSYQTRMALGFALVTLMGLPVCGIIIRMDTMIIRMARLLRWLGDPREAFKIADRAPNFIPYGDGFCLVLVLVVVVYSATQAWSLWQPPNLLSISLGVVFTFAVFLLYLWAGYTISQVLALGRYPLPTAEEVERYLPSKVL